MGHQSALLVLLHGEECSVIHFIEENMAMCHAWHFATYNDFQFTVKIKLIQPLADPMAKFIVLVCGTLLGTTQ